jgi:hypothetical protein
MLFKSLIKCSNCNYSFRGRVERGKTKYRCNNRLKNGLEACSNNSALDERELEDVIQKQFNLYGIKYIADNEYLVNIINKIDVSKNGEYVIVFKDNIYKNTVIENKKIIYGTC